ncbi:MAG: FAD-dependent oxidoreductase, partial [Desulfobacterales bacterium]|nr:FAD-dependent oxidoreductase [Desulfobacterales bacterium]
MATKVCIIGGGPGGYIAALRASALGADVTIIEKENLGGTCLNWGCIPSKIMKNSADILHKCQRAQNFGICIQGSISADMEKLMAQKEKILVSQRRGLYALLTGKGIKVVLGAGKIIVSGQIEVTSLKGAPITLSYDKLIIAVGTSPLNVPDFPFDHEKILSSNDILNLDYIPDSMTIVGGGVIGCEFACIFATLGTKVTIVEAMSRLLPLPSVDTDTSKVLLREMKKKKIKVICDAIVTSCSPVKKGVGIKLAQSPFTDNPKPKALKSLGLESQIMAVCIGRTPLSSNIGLENIGLSTQGPGWIDVNDKMETCVKNVYAIGDILGPNRVMLAHVASHEGVIAAENAMGKNINMSYKAIPGGIFTMPEIGIVGLSEQEAKEQGK